jgi:hypothetical protein
MSLTGKTKASTYKDLLTISNNNNGIGTSVKSVMTGEGTSSSLQLSDDNSLVKPNNDNTATTVFSVDTINSQVKAGKHAANNVLTQYKDFGVFDYTSVSGYHHPMSHGSFIQSPSGDEFDGDVNGTDFGGNSANPATTLTIASASKELIPSLWIVNDSIELDSVNYFVAGSSGGGTINIHLMKYDVVAGTGTTAGDLSNGIVYAQSGSSSGSLSPITYRGTAASNGSITLNKTSVASGQGILVFFEQVTGSDKITIQTTIKYHLA